MTEQKAIGWTLEKATVEALERARLGLRALRLEAAELVCADLEALVDTATAACLNEARQQWLARKEDILTASDEAMKLRAECSRLRTELGELRQNHLETVALLADIASAGAFLEKNCGGKLWADGCTYDLDAESILEAAAEHGWTPEAKP